MSVDQFYDDEDENAKDKKQALLLLRVRSKELEQNERGYRRERPTLQFAAKNTGRLMLRNLEKLEDENEKNEGFEEGKV